MKLRWKRVEISGGFLLLAAALYYFDTQNILPWAAAAAAAHELGHYGVIRLFGGRVAALRLSCVGAEMILSARSPLSNLGDLLSALSGPGLNLLLAFFTARLATVWGEDWYLFAGMNLGFAAFNLLPVAQLDGGRALRALLALRWSRPLADRILQVCSVSISMALVLGGGFLVLEGRASFTLLITALWLMAVTVRGVNS